MPSRYFTQTPRTTPSHTTPSRTMPSRTIARLAALTLMAAAPFGLLTTTFVPPASSQQLRTIVPDLPTEDRVALERGDVVVSGRDGQFVARVLVDADATAAWDVLTDYDNFASFLPNIESSQLLETEGDRNQFEQVNVINVLPFVTTRSRIVIESTESYPQQVVFSLVSGDLDDLQGVWLLEPVGDKVLVTHEVLVDPGSGSPRGIFMNTYRSILEDSLSAAKQETERRASETSSL